MTATYNLRLATPSDEPLLREIFAADKAHEFAPLGLPAQQLEALIEMQFRARQHHYAQAFPTAVDHILCSEDGTAVGRHLVERQPNGYRGIDLAILPEHRNAGLGSWALRQIQQLAALEGVTFRLSVFRSNAHALRLYERLGFLKFSTDDISYEMEWHPAMQHAKGIVTNQGLHLRHSGETSRTATTDAQHLLDRILPFLRELLPGIQPIANGLRVDTAALLYPGDLLHEAGHLAVMTPGRRAAEFPTSTDAAEEMATLAWSYAAAVHLGLPPEVVFHEHGYRGQAQALLQSFQSEQPIGLPYLWWIGLTTQSFPGQPSIFPRMTRWLREEAVHDLEPQLELVGSA
jgi:GNAT superfamily N-acetyltransferase